MLAHLLRPQGRKGELLAELLTDFPDRFSETSLVYLAPPMFEGSPEMAIPATIVSHWLPHGRNEGRIVLAFEHIRSIEEAERIAGLDVVVSEQTRVELTDGSIYVDELIGCTLYDGEIAVGPVSDVHYVTTSDGKRRLTETAPLLTVANGEDEILIPFAKEFLVSLDTGGRRIVMELPEGLLDLNRRTTAAGKATQKP